MCLAKIGFTKITKKNKEKKCEGCFEVRYGMSHKEWLIQ